MAETTRLTDRPSFNTLSALAAELQRASIAQMFADDSKRASGFALNAAGLSLDFSKQLLSSKALGALIQLGQETRLRQRAADLLSGQPLNSTENRPALHSLLRARAIPVTEANKSLDAKFREVLATRERMKQWADAVNGGEHKGHSGNNITDVVNIGIGGSNLGPRLVTEALTPYRGKLGCHYVANVDPTDLQDTLARLNPASTLFIICSKSFHTEETLANALAARQWMLQGGASSDDLDKHFLAITSNLEAAAQFGINPENCLPLWDWVGGRYSLWSAIGLSCAIALGWDNFQQLLDGAATMDDHFASADIEFNMPMLLSLLEVWNCNFLGAASNVILPYDQHLQGLPDFLQQLTMESNGKRVSESGAPLTHLCPVDFILPLTSHTDMPDQHRILVANCLAQSRALMVGRSVEEAHSALQARGLDESEATRLAPHLAMPGNRPSSTITMDSLTPATLGALLALYEHRTFCSGQLWGINPFDQWGVELGKEIGTEVLAELSGEAHDPDMDPSTAQLIARWRALQ